MKGKAGASGGKLMFLHAGQVLLSTEHQSSFRFIRNMYVFPSILFFPSFPSLFCLFFLFYLALQNGSCLFVLFFSTFSAYKRKSLSAARLWLRTYHDQLDATFYLLIIFIYCMVSQYHPEVTVWWITRTSCFNTVDIKVWHMVWFNHNSLLP
jgi:hypothetical protein